MSSNGISVAGVAEKPADLFCSVVMIYVETSHARGSPTDCTHPALMREHLVVPFIVKINTLLSPLISADGVSKGLSAPFGLKVPSVIVSTGFGMSHAYRVPRLPPTHPLPGSRLPQFCPEAVHTGPAGCHLWPGRVVMAVLQQTPQSAPQSGLHEGVAVSHRRHCSISPLSVPIWRKASPLAKR